MTYKFLAESYEKQMRYLLNKGYDREDENVVELATVLMAVQKQVQVKAENMRCPRCKHDFEKRSNHCPECGQKVRF